MADLRPSSCDVIGREMIADIVDCCLFTKAINQSMKTKLYVYYISDYFPEFHLFYSKKSIPLPSMLISYKSQWTQKSIKNNTLVNQGNYETDNIDKWIHIYIIQKMLRNLVNSSQLNTETHLHIYILYNIHI